MKITKFAHACVLLEDNGKVVLIDPGNFAWEAGQIKPADWPKVDEIAVTHGHGDHFHPPFVEALHQAFPDATWVAPEEVAAKLTEMGITKVSATGTDLIKVSPVQHERMPMGTPPQNIQVDVFGKFTHPGDSHQSTVTMAVMGMPFVSPWGSMTAGSDVVLKLKPKKVVPVHDALWTDGAKQWMYGMLRDYYKEQGIELIIPVEGEPFEV